MAVTTGVFARNVVLKGGNTYEKRGKNSSYFDNGYLCDRSRFSLRHLWLQFWQNG